MVNSNFSPQNTLAGDHVLPQQAFKDAIDAYELANGGDAFRRNVDGLKELQNGSDNLRPMLSNLNSSKGMRAASEWIETPLGAGVYEENPGYSDRPGGNSKLGRREGQRDPGRQFRQSEFLSSDPVMLLRCGTLARMC